MILISMLQYNYIRHVSHHFLYVFIALIIRNYLLLSFIHLGTRGKPNISDHNHFDTFRYEFHYYVASSTAIEAITHIIVRPTTVMSYSLFTDLVYFIPISFYFEIIFDLFHYIFHRLLHHKYLYKYIHKTHHTFDHPTAIITFYQDPIDLLLTNSIPTVFTLAILPQISYVQFTLIMTYKVFIEISGHIGKKMYPTSCFSQCIWLPRSLEIELYTEDHDLHHTMNNCNYGKRFSLYDKLFGTYK